MHELEGLFNAQSVVIVGVSSAPGSQYFAFHGWPASPGGRVAFNLRHFRYRGQVFLVGRSGGDLDGQPILRDIDDVPGPFDLAVITVPRHAALEAIDKCGRKGARWIVLPAAGFSEYSTEFATVEDEIRAVLRRYGMRLVGPNGLGIFNFANGLALPFAPMNTLPLLPGPVSIISQSGSVATLLGELVSELGPGLNKFISVGNKLDLDEADYLDYLAEDPSTEIIAMYLEGFCRGEAFVEAARRCRKPMLLFKNTGRASERMARSHTAALASDDRVVDAALRRAGIIRFGALRDLAIATGVLRLPALRGNSLAAICPSGGLSVIAADKAEKHGFVFAKIDQQILSDVESKGVAKIIHPSNPMDLGDLYEPAFLDGLCRRILAQPNVDALVAILYETALPWVESTFADARLRSPLAAEDSDKWDGKPVLISCMDRVAGLGELSRRIKYPLIGDPEEAMDALVVLRDYSRLRAERDRPATTTVDVAVDPSAAARGLAAATSGGRRELGLDCAPVLTAYGLPIVVAPRLARSEGDASDIADSLGVPVAIKIHSRDVLHKSDSGGIRLNVAGGRAAAEAFRAIVETVRSRVPDARIEGVDVQPMIGEGREVIVGAKRDPQFGPVVMFGLGGIYTEVLDEVSLRLAPVTRGEALEMIEGTKAARLLGAVRGQPAADKEALADVIARLSLLLRDFPPIAEVDLNPVIVLPASRGCQIVDARLILNP